MKHIQKIVKNTKTFLSRALVLGGLLAVVSCKQQENKVISTTNTPQVTNVVTPTVAQKTILFFGNSLTAAFGLAKEDGFPAIIQQKLDSLGLAYQCINAGLSGETTSEGLERVDWLLEQTVDVFVLELGANDAFRGQKTTTVEKNLQGIIDKVRKKYPSCKIVLAGMLAPPNLGRAYTDDFAKIYPTLAKRNNIALIPFLLEGVAAKKSLNLPDGIHPTAEGQRIVAENVWKILKPAL